MSIPASGWPTVPLTVKSPAEVEPPPPSTVYQSILKESSAPAITGEARQRKRSLVSFMRCFFLSCRCAYADGGGVGGVGIGGVGGAPEPPPLSTMMRAI